MPSAIGPADRPGIAVTDDAVTTTRFAGASGARDERPHPTAKASSATATIRLIARR
jgi:hypothetical protein